MKLDRHPDPLTLLAWSEGELPALRGWMVARHVRSCWDCRAKARHWENITAEVAAGVSTLPEPSRVDTAKALWRFRAACQDIVVAEQRRWWRLRPAWVTPALSVLAVASVAVVAIHNPPRREEPTKPPQFSRPPAPRPTAPRPTASSLEPSPRSLETLKSAPELPLTAPVVDVLPPPSEEDLLSAEVYAIYELHRARLCRLEVERLGSVVEVHGVMVSPEQRTRLAALFQEPEYRGLIRLRFEDVAVAQAHGQPVTALAHGGATIAPLEERLRERYKGQATQRDIFNLMGDLAVEAETLSEHAWAVRRLAERFPASRTRTLQPALRDLLLRIASDHSVIVAGAAEALWKRLAPDADTAGASFQASDPGGRNQNWQDRAVMLQELAEAAATGVLSSVSRSSGLTPPPRDRFEYCAAAAKGLHATLQTQLAQSQ
jgi:hypothetical protein